jgi:NAD+ diphosphatase
VERLSNVQPRDETLSQRDYKFCPLSGHRLEAAQRGDRERSICPDPDCGFVHWDNPVPVVAAIVEHDERIVLVRSIGRPPTWYGLVAGFLEQAEHPDDAVLREIGEEIGLTPKRCTFLGNYSFARMNQIIFVYYAEIPSLDIRLDDTELEDFKIVPITELKPWSQGTGPALRDWLASRGYHPPVVEFGEHV